MAPDKKPTLAFVDHSFHQKTKCTDFLKEILREKFIIADYWDHGWENGNKISVEKVGGYDYIIFFQILPPLDELKKIKGKIIWAPMYDSLRDDPLFWKKLSLLPIKILSFSGKISSYCRKYGLEKIDLQYFKNPEEYQRNIPGKKNIYFFGIGGTLLLKT